MLFFGKWITAPAFAGVKPINIFHKQRDTAFTYTPDPAFRNVHTVFRAVLNLSDPGGVFVRISADDCYKLYINGVFVCQGPAPGYPFLYRYNLVDLSGYVREGENEIRVHVCYQGLINRVLVSGDMRCGLIADFCRGEEVLLSTGPGWQCAPVRKYLPAPTFGYDTQFAEYADLRIPDGDFSDARVYEGADYRFAQTPAPLLQTRVRVPVSVRREGEKLFCDFGEEVVGHIRVRAHGERGSRITVRAGEELDESGHVRFRMRCNCVYEDYLILCGQPAVHTQFDYKGFRYVELIAGEGAVADGCEVLERHAPFDERLCTLKTSVPLLDRIFAMCKAGVRCGTQEVFVDCPTREKGQYAGDLTVTSASQLLLTGDPAMLRKAVEDQMASARICPGLMAVTPGALMQEIADYSLQFPLLAERLYEYTKDREMLLRSVAVCRGMLDYFGRFTREDGLLDRADEKWNLVDWPESARDGYELPCDCACHNVLNAYYVGAHQVTERLERLAGQKPAGRAQGLRDAYCKAFFSPQTGLFTDLPGGTHSALHSNALPAFFGLVPAGAEKSVGEFLFRKGFSCGVYMAYFLLHGLIRLGRAGDALSLLLSEGPHSYANMLREGASTCFEAWGKEQKKNTSLCHPWASAPVSVIAEGLLNIRPGLSVAEMQQGCRMPRIFSAFRMQVPMQGRLIRVALMGGEFEYEEVPYEAAEKECGACL